MKNIISLLLVLFLAVSFTQASAENEKSAKTKIILLISEQNIESPQRAWWASEVDLSTTEATVAKSLIEEGYEVLEPSSLGKVIKKDRAFRLLNLSESKSIKLGNLSRADFVILGKAIASSGAKVLQSNLVSCFANVTAKLIRVKDGKVIVYLDASGNSAHMDVISGGREALASAGSDLAAKVIDALRKEGGK